MPSELPSDEADRSQTTARRLLFAALLNLPLAAVLWIDVLPPLIAASAVIAVVLLVPGAGWFRCVRADDVACILKIVLVSIGLSVAVVVVLALAGMVSRNAYLLSVFTIANVGLWVRRNARVDSVQPPDADAVAVRKVLLLCAGLFFLVSFDAATRRIPPLEDHDSEMQGTAWALVHELEPAMVTNRGTVHYFAHPLLLHQLTAVSALLFGDLEGLRYYRDTVAAVENAPYDEHVAIWRERILPRFRASPFLLATRTINVGLGALALLTLGFLAFEVTRSRHAALLACLLYGTLPEVYVRSSYGGYYAGTAFFMLSTAWFYMEALDARSERQHQRVRYGWPFAFAFGLASANHKGVLIPLAALVHSAVRRGWVLRESLRESWPMRSAFAVTAGFLLGWTAFAIYGLALEPVEFMRDHLGRHLINRILPGARPGGATPVRYPDALTLWATFADGTGWLLCAAALVALAVAVRHMRRPDGLFVAWVLAGALAGTLVDWRQTKHLSLILAPIILLTVVLWNRLTNRPRAVMLAILIAAITWNAWSSAKLGMAFRSFRMPGGW